MRDKLIERFKRDSNNVLVILAATVGVIFLSTVVVLVVRAYLTAKTNDKLNEFAPMTYTNTEITESKEGWEEKQDASSFDIYVDKNAKVHNLAGTDKKPVFVRVAVTYSVYSNEGINVTSDYPCKVLFDHNSAYWTKKEGEDYYYYNYVINPSESTEEFFDLDKYQLDLDGNGENEDYSVKLDFDQQVPAGYRVEIDVIADTVQAVAIDSAKWTSADYTVAEMNKAWGKNLAEGAFNHATKAVTW